MLVTRHLKIYLYFLGFILNFILLMYLILRFKFVFSFRLGLCLKCSGKLNYHKKRKEVKRVKKVKSKVGVPDPSSRSLAGCVSDIKRDEPAETPTDGGQLASTSQSSSADEDLWKQPLEEPQQISREEEFEKYLEELLL